MGRPGVRLGARLRSAWQTARPWVLVGQRLSSDPFIAVPLTALWVVTVALSVVSGVAALLVPAAPLWALWVTGVLLWALGSVGFIMAVSTREFVRELGAPAPDNAWARYYRRKE